MNHNNQLTQRASPHVPYNQVGEKTLGVGSTASYAPARCPSSTGVSVRGLVIGSGMVLTMLLTFALGPPLEMLAAVATLGLAGLFVTLPPRRRPAADVHIVLPELRADHPGPRHREG